MGESGIKPNMLVNEDLEFSATVNIPEEDWEKLTSLPPKDGVYKITYTCEVQIRRHRKRRINKKWLKRYGCRQVRRTLSVRRMDAEE